MNKPEVEFQVRKTFEDTKNKQNALSDFIEERTINPIIIPKTKKNYKDMVADSLLSQGKNKTFRIKIQEDNKIKYIKFAPSLHTALLLMAEVEANDLKEGEDVILQIPYAGETYEISMKQIWSELYVECLNEFPLALGESLHMSAEAPYRSDEEIEAF